MGDKRSDGYINLDALYGAPRPDSGGLPRPDPTCGPVFVSHELQLRRDLEIANARIAAELGPLPSGGLPVQFKPRIDAKGRPLPQLSNAQTYEEEAMNLKQVPAAVVMTAALAACEPQIDIAFTDQTRTAAPAAERAAPVASETQAPPKAAAAPEHVTADAAPAVPDEIRAFVPPASTLLAYKRFDLTGNGNEDAVLIVRHPVIQRHAAPSKNPCDLIVLHGHKAGYKEVAKNSEVIDCTYNVINQKAGYLGLNDLLEVSRRTVVFTNDNIRGGYYSYLFKHSIKNDRWYFKKAVSTYKGHNPDSEYVEIYEETVTYPNDVKLISMSEFDPETIKRAMEKSAKLVP